MSVLPRNRRFIVLFVDDTLVFSKRQEDIDHVSARLNRHYNLTLVTERNYPNNGTFYNRSAKQTLVSTSSTHAEMRALYIHTGQGHTVYHIHKHRERQ